MSDSVIIAENLSKLYRIGVISTGLLTSDINRIWHRILKKENDYQKIGEVNDRSQKNNSNYIWALKDINFEVKKGELIGIIGRNGAGKSTMLKILSRVTSPTKGRVLLKGKVSSLLEVGTGFHQELTGRENIYLNGSILGMTKNEIKKKFDDIAEFSGIGNYIDTPVKRYSSGMYVRLAFAVAAHLDPDILILDEVLAVGDANFQKKCLGKIHEVSDEEGKTVLFVSHNMSAIKNLCRRGIILEHGKILFDGDVDTAVSKYLASNETDTGENLKTRTNRAGSNDLIFSDIKIKNQRSEVVSQIISGEELTIELKYECRKKLSGNVIVSVTFKDNYENTTAIFVSDEMGIRFDNLQESGTFYLKIPKLLLRGDNYFIGLFASLDNTRAESILDKVERAAELHVLPGDFWKSGKINRTGNFGIMEGKFHS